MSVTEQTLPAGTWALDPVHSKASFAVKHAGLSTFRGSFDDVSATLEDGVLRIWRDDPDFAQRFSATLGPDSFEARGSSPAHRATARTTSR